VFHNVVGVGWLTAKPNLMAAREPFVPRSAKAKGGISNDEFRISNGEWRVLQIANAGLAQSKVNSRARS
jgi:hypothetical protein